MVVDRGDIGPMAMGLHINVARWQLYRAVASSFNIDLCRRIGSGTGFDKMDALPIFDQHLKRLVSRFCDRLIIKFLS